MSFWTDLVGDKSVGQVVGGAIGGALSQNNGTPNTQTSGTSFGQSSSGFTGIPVTVSADNSQLYKILYTILAVAGAFGLFFVVKAIKGNGSHPQAHKF